MNTSLEMGKLILASASPRRKQLLEAAGIPCEVMPSQIEERPFEQEPPEEFVCRVAQEKAQEVMALLSAERPRTVLGADTEVILDGRVFGKPGSPEEAAAMLRALSGRTHQVITGVCLLHRRIGTSAKGEGLWKDIRVAKTMVRFLPLSEPQVREYIATGEAFDKAGGYGIQGHASRFVESIEGCYFNVVGLPVSLVCQMLQALADKLQLGSPGSE